MESTKKGGEPTLARKKAFFPQKMLVLGLDMLPCTVPSVLTMQKQNKKNHKSNAIIKQLSYIFAAAFCILTTLACSHLYLIDSPQKLEFDFYSNKPLIIKILYTSEASANFSDERAVALEAPASSQYIKLSFDIPSKTPFTHSKPYHILSMCIEETYLYNVIYTRCYFTLLSFLN